MTMTQKRWLEVPILLAIIWLSQALELSLLHLPYYLGTPQLVSLLIAYVAFSRGWTSIMIIGFVLSFLGAANNGYPTGLYIAAHLWAALLMRIVVSALTLEGRSAFVLLVASYDIFLKTLTWTLLKFLGASTAVPLFLAQFAAQTTLMAICAWLLFPVFRKWDEYFLHALDEDSLGPATTLR